eukprot:11051484-Alexandrium_andersonii.AAC.1
MCIRDRFRTTPSTSASSWVRARAGLGRPHPKVPGSRASSGQGSTWASSTTSGPAASSLSPSFSSTS